MCGTRFGWSSSARCAPSRPLSIASIATYAHARYQGSITWIPAPGITSSTNTKSSAAGYTAAHHHTRLLVPALPTYPQLFTGCLLPFTAASRGSNTTAQGHCPGPSSHQSAQHDHMWEGRISNSLRLPRCAALSCIEDLSQHACRSKLAHCHE